MLNLNPSDWFLTTTDHFEITNPSVILSGPVQTTLEQYYFFAVEFAQRRVDNSPIFYYCNCAYKVEFISCSIWIWEILNPPHKTSLKCVKIYVGGLEASTTIGLRVAFFQVKLLQITVCIIQIFRTNSTDSKKVNPCSNMVSLNSYAFENDV